MNPEGEPKPEDLAKQGNSPDSKKDLIDHSKCKKEGDRPMPHTQEGFVLCSCGSLKRV